jgi:7,8-dihydropterin-6-yl-methyl-4-(beta-D-ribofuranosyl)aminobenzene 5'-phosphate synthase
MIQITTLSENTASALGLLAEWGLSILVETDEAVVLLDSGQSFSAVRNADVMGIDLKKVNRIVLSHGHSDHVGGLLNIVRLIRKPLEIIAHPDVLAAKYSGKQEDKRRYVGVPFQIAALESLGARFNLSRKPVKITDHIMTTGEIPEVTDFEQIEPDHFFVKDDSEWQHDSLADDQALIINAEAGLIVVLGCAHRGIINTLYHAREISGRQEIQMVIGGCHLMNASNERINKTITALKELDVRKIGVSHCTGQETSAIMAQELGERFFFNNAGTQIKISGTKIDID